MSGGQHPRASLGPSAHVASFSVILPRGVRGSWWKRHGEVRARSTRDPCNNEHFRNIMHQVLCSVVGRGSRGGKKVGRRLVLSSVERESQDSAVTRWDLMREGIAWGRFVQSWCYVSLSIQISESSVIFTTPPCDQPLGFQTILKAPNPGLRQPTYKDSIPPVAFPASPQSPLVIYPVPAQVQISLLF